MDVMTANAALGKAALTEGQDWPKAVADAYYNLFERFDVARSIEVAVSMAKEIENDLSVVGPQTQYAIKACLEVSWLGGEIANDIQRLLPLFQKVKSLDPLRGYMPEAELP